MRGAFHSAPTTEIFVRSNGLSDGAFEVTRTDGLASGRIILHIDDV